MKKIFRTCAVLIVVLVLSLEAKAATPSTASLSENAPAVLVQEGTPQQWQKKLLGPYAKVTLLSAYNIQSAYITFIEHVRTLHGSWTGSDWGQAETVLNDLDSKKSTLESQLTLNDKARIKAIQSEFNALKAASIAKN